MTAPPNPLATYQAVVQKVDEFWRRATDAQPSAYACRPGCASCCQPDLSVHPVEALVIQEHLAHRSAPPETTPPPSPSQSPEDACAFLQGGVCAIYPVRPILCRTHGLAVRADGRVDACPLNFTQETWRADAVLDLEHLNLLLALANRELLRHHGLPEDTPRVPLRDLERGAWVSPFPGGRAAP